MAAYLKHCNEELNSTNRASGEDFLPRNSKRWDGPFKDRFEGVVRTLAFQTNKILLQ